jgi:glutamate N-acetyltransferase / amino-acid N-acetyltransferase
MEIIKKAILPQGFKANGLASGIKKSGKLDLALIYSDFPAVASGKFTANKIKAAPLKLNKLYLKKNKSFRAIIANSGNANCFNGSQGFRDAVRTSEMLARRMEIKNGSVLVASTGIIGKRLPVGCIEKALPELVRGLASRGIDKAKKAIMTTDTFPKEITVKLRIRGCPITVCGIAKGAGMISPNMATMLCFVMTDAVISARALNKALGAAVEDSFNCITVDGCMSTNDNVIALANGSAGNKLVDGGADLDIFLKALRMVCLELAKMMVKDGEGATKFIRIMVKQARSFAEAKKAGLAIANSNLFKTAVYGENPNFGRIAASVGASGIDVREENLKVKLGPLTRRQVDVEVLLGRGKACAAIYTSDLTPEYIKINAAYN